MFSASTRVFPFRSLLRLSPCRPAPSPTMTSAYAQLSQNGLTKGPAQSSYTITGLSRWSVINKQLPPVDQIKSLHIYDFDNTLFKTPLPNAALWTGPTIGSLSSQDVLVNGGWWHDSRILAATGEGADAEEKRAWDGWWNEKIVDLIRLSTSQKDALCVLLTGRSERGFAEIIKRMVDSKGLEFDMVGLKPAVSPTNQSFTSTMHFKQLFLTVMMETYKGAEEIRIYEDRPKHVKGFRDFLNDYNRRKAGYENTRGPLSTEVILVADTATTLDPVVEVAEVQHMIDLHNETIKTPKFKRQPAKQRPPRLTIKKTVFFTGYLLDKKDTETLKGLAKEQISGTPDNDLKFHANNILICPRPCPASIMEKVGGMGAKMAWQVTGIGCFENFIWAASLRPIPATAKFHTDNPSPFVVLALRKGARPIDAGKIQNWQPVSAEQALTFETTVGEKVMLRIEPEDPREDEYESLFANKASKRKHAGDDGQAGFRGSGPGSHGQDGYYQQQNPRGGRNDRRDFHSSSRGGRGGFRGGARGGGGGGGGNGGFKGGQRGNGKGNRGRGGNHHYRSLDDVEPRNQQGGYGVSVEYDEPASSGAGFPSNAPSGPSADRGPAGQNGAANTSDLQDYY